ncbi:MAG: lysine--tRNA ligase [bacterium]
MSTIDEIKKTRLEKLRNLEKAGLVYPGKTKRTHTVAEALQNFAKLKKLGKEIILVGRIRSLRSHGKATFIHFEDGSGKIQAFFREDHIGKRGYSFFIDNFDIGDFIELRGSLFKTKRGEKTIETTDFKILAKSLSPLPEKWHGLTDTEERYRKRYLDLIFNKEAKHNFVVRAKVISEIRNFLESEGFLEVETPILQPIYGGARAKPFRTHLNALDMDIFLRISPELYLKRLLIGGFEKVFELGKCFRNEGMDKFHNPDFTILEFYWAFADYKDLMKITERMFFHILKKTFGKTVISYQGNKLSFKAPWPRIDFNTFFRKETKLDYDLLSEQGLLEEAKKLGVEVDKGASKTAIVDEVFKKFCRPKIIQPSFVINYPLGFQTLAKSVDDRSEKLANFQLIAGGTELVNAFSELNDPLEQKKRFEEQERLSARGFEEAHKKDDDFVEALEYGMPLAAGFGMGIDRLVLLLTDSSSLREIILFPIMRPKDKS